MAEHGLVYLSYMIEVNRVLLLYKDYLTYELPNDWCAEEEQDNLLIYNPSGEGAITISFLNIPETSETLGEYISIIAKKFIDQNRIALRNPFILYGTEKNKITLYGTGTTSDNWFIKLWVVAKHPKIVFATYQCKKKTSEIKKCDAIIDSIKFSF